MASTLRLRKHDLSWANVDDGEIVALRVSSSEYLSVNSSGTVLWALLDRGATREELVRTLVDSYSLDDAAAERDVDSFLDDLRSRGVLDEE